MDFGGCKRDSWSKLVFGHRPKAGRYVRSLRIKMERIGIGEGDIRYKPSGLQCPNPEEEFGGGHQILASQHLFQKPFPKREIFFCSIVLHYHLVSSLLFNTKKKKKGRKQITVLLETRKAGNPNADQHAMY
jgi:hypothetical protein